MQPLSQYLEPSIDYNVEHETLKLQGEHCVGVAAKQTILQKIAGLRSSHVLSASEEDTSPLGAELRSSLQKNQEGDNKLLSTQYVQGENSGEDSVNDSDADMISVLKLHGGRWPITVSVRVNSQDLTWSWIQEPRH